MRLPDHPGDPGVQPQLASEVTPRFGEEKLAALLKEPNIGDLIAAYWEELSPMKGVAPLNPDWASMIEREKRGEFFVWAARADKTLIGFIAFHVVNHLNYRDTLFAIDAGHFLDASTRGNGQIGFRMWRTAEAALRKKNVRVIMAHDNAARPLLPFFLALGFEPRSTIFWKALT